MKKTVVTTNKKKYKVTMTSGVWFYKELNPASVRTYLRTTPGVACIIPEGYTPQFNPNR